MLMLKWKWRSKSYRDAVEFSVLLSNRPRSVSQNVCKAMQQSFISFSLVLLHSEISSSLIHSNPKFRSGDHKAKKFSGVKVSCSQSQVLRVSEGCGAFRG